jgi:threonine synthase
MLTRIAHAFGELVELGWVADTPVRYVGAQASGCAPVATAWAGGAAGVAPVRSPDTIVRSLAIGSPADGLYALELARASAGSIEAVDDATTAASIRRAARLEGIYPETAGGVTLGGVEAARRRGVIREGDTVVALLTGNGLKTPEAVRFGLADEELGATAGRPGLAPVLPARFEALDAWLSA